MALQIQKIPTRNRKLKLYILLFKNYKHDQIIDTISDHYIEVID